MGGIFISYRQADAKAWAIGLRDDLAQVFGEDHVFLDKETLHAGNWHEQIQHALESCKVVLVVIGPRWLTIVDEQNRPRLQLADDVHRQEIALALRRPDVTVIPVLVDEAAMPRANQLPSDLHALADQQARPIGDTRARREADLTVLINDIRSVGGLQPQARPKNRRELGLAGARTGLPGLSGSILGITLALTLGAAMFGYLVNSQLNISEVSFLSLVFYFLVLGVRWLWVRFRSGRRGEM
jgi:hypothetical protein